MNSEFNGVEKSMNYYLTKRKKAKRSYFYVNFTDPNDSRKILLSTSVELLRRKIGISSRLPVTREKEAYAIVERAIADGLINLDRDTKNFADYVLDFWDFDRSEYIRRRNQKSPNSIGKDYAMNMLGCFKKHAQPNLPSRLNLHEVTANHIEKVIDTLLDEGRLSNATIKRVVQSMSVPLKEATRKKWVAHNPMDGVEVIANTYQQRGIYTVSEIQKILDYLYIKGTVGVTEQWKTRGPNKTLVERPRLVRIGLKPYLATALAAYTGMRSGEIRALTSEQIRLIDEQFGIISVDRAVNDYAGQKSTKGKRTRKVPLKRTLCELLIKEAEQNPHQGGKMIFWSEKSSTNPVSSSYILNHFYKALDAIGITEEQRLERNIDFHSLRHTFNSNLRGLINEKSLRAVVGHESVEMSDRYTHETDEDLLLVGNAVISVFKGQENQSYIEQKIEESRDDT
jgi:integrase